MTFCYASILLAHATGFVAQEPLVIVQIAVEGSCVPRTHRLQSQAGHRDTETQIVGAIASWAGLTALKSVLACGSVRVSCAPEIRRFYEKGQGTAP
jgi:hypothetical protein